MFLFLNRKREANEKGFSFIELVIVVAVIGILTSIAIPSYGAIQSNAKQAAVDANAQIGYRLVAATIAGFDVNGSATTVGKAKTPAQALESLSVKDGEEGIKLSFLDRSGAVITNPGEDFCVWAYDTRELAAGVPLYSATVGYCPPANVKPTIPGYVPPVTNPTDPPVTTPEPSPEPTNPPVVTPEPEPTNPPETEPEVPVSQPLVLNSGVPTPVAKSTPYTATGTQATGTYGVPGAGRGVTTMGNKIYTIVAASSTDDRIVESAAGASRASYTAVPNATLSNSRITDLGTDGTNLYFSGSNGRIYKNTVGTSWNTGHLNIDNVTPTVEGSVIFSSGSTVYRLDTANGAVTKLVSIEGIGLSINGMAIGESKLFIMTNLGLYTWQVGGTDVARIASASWHDIVFARIGSQNYLYGVGIHTNNTNSILRIRTDGASPAEIRPIANTSANTYTDIAMTDNGDIYLRGPGNLTGLVR